MRLQHANNTDPIDVTWEGKLSVATATYMQIWNRTSSRWENWTQNLTPTANTDFTLNNSTTTVSHYYDVTNTYRVRVVTGTTTGAMMMSTDAFMATVPSPDVVQLHYRFRRDDGSEITAGYLQAEDTQFSLVNYKGDRTRLRILLSNAGAGPSTNYMYRLEYASSSCSAWYPVPQSATWEEWQMDLSQYVLDAIATTDSSGLSNPGGKTFTPGYVKLAGNTTPQHTITSSQFTEHEYAFRSTNAVSTDTLYCFRLTNAGSTTNFTYTVRPEIMLRGGMRQEAGGPQNIESLGGGTLVTGGGQSGGGGAESGGSGSGRGGGNQGGGGGAE